MTAEASGSIWAQAANACGSYCVMATDPPTLPNTTTDTFQLTNNAGKITIAGNNTNTRAAGLRWYLAHHCGMHFSSTGVQKAIPNPLPLPTEAPRTSPWKWRSAHNHTVFSYSMAFWDTPAVLLEPLLLD